MKCKEILFQQSILSSKEELMKSMSIFSAKPGSMFVCFLNYVLIFNDRKPLMHLFLIGGVSTYKVPSTLYKLVAFYILKQGSKSSIVKKRRDVPNEDCKGLSLPECKDKLHHPTHTQCSSFTPVMVTLVLAFRPCWMRKSAPKLYFAAEKSQFWFCQWNSSPVLCITMEQRRIVSFKTRH